MYHSSGWRNARVQGLSVSGALPRHSIGILELFARQNHFPDLHGFLKVIELMGLDPPCGSFHQQVRVVVLVVKEGLEGQADGLAFLGDFVVADLNRFGA